MPAAASPGRCVRRSVVPAAEVVQKKKTTVVTAAEELEPYQRQQRLVDQQRQLWFIHTLCKRGGWTERRIDWLIDAAALGACKNGNPSPSAAALAGHGTLFWLS